MHIDVINEKKITHEAHHAISFEEVAVKYGLVTTTQVKERIIWENLKAIVINLYGDDPINRKILNRYQSEWRACEDEEKKDRNRNRY